MPLIIIIVVVAVFIALKDALGVETLWTLGALIVAGLIALLVWTAKDDNDSRERREEKRLMMREIDKKARYLLDALDLKSAKDIPISGRGLGLIGFNSSEVVIAKVAISSSQMSYDLTEDRLPLNDIVEVEWDHRSEQRTRTEKIHGSDTEYKNKSTIGRALVGGVVLGPLGAVAGAASAGGPKIKKKDPDKREIEYTHTHKPRLIIQVNREQKPFIYLEMKTADDASEMAKLIAHRVKMSQGYSQANR